jgi:hypothetical protein
MARKKPDLTDIFAKTTGQQGEEASENPDLDEGRIVSAGVGIKEGELRAIESIAAGLGKGITKNAVMRFALRWFILQVRAGNVDLSGFVEEPPEPDKRLKMP